ncbi:MAG TPA: phosphatase PAP2 family protein [Phycisphaerae bacterium]|nr:phosphatase PAP2 family protein [Phycisphaerae bacterium]HOJ75792.1 phosphatase PAP2 family protein [Phycisphaerae bacterium]HOM53178.1 phosphatase PAP2 family protein [Phycisphaerae bacterium]HOQ87460.1 phosphatase PAP2 family protein [Phycisphaerae bacterium]HPP28303.1 phosphatase PAP2 family protein [Phycisphaerae bacterium]
MRIAVAVLAGWGGLLAGCASRSVAGNDWPGRAEATANMRLSSHSTACVAPTSGWHRTVETPATSIEFPRFSLAAMEESSTGEAAVSATLPADASVPAESPADEPSGEGTVTAEAEPVQRGPLPGFGETVKRDLREMPGVLWSDTKAAFGNPWNLLLLASAGGASIALRTTDADDQADRNFRNHPTFNSCWADTFGAIGNPATHFALAGVWYLAGQQMQDDKTYEVGRKLFSALIINGVTTMGLKVAAWDDSPNGEWGAWPSGHVSSTMTVATVLNRAYGPLVGVPMFGLTGLVAVERMDSREHWLSDVVFGAVLGWVVGETVFKEHQPEIMGGAVVPYVDPVYGGAGLAWVKPLGEPAPKPVSH